MHVERGSSLWASQPSQPASQRRGSASPLLPCPLDRTRPVVLRLGVDAHKCLQLLPPEEGALLAQKVVKHLRKRRGSTTAARSLAAAAAERRHGSSAAPAARQCSSGGGGAAAAAAAAAAACLAERPGDGGCNDHQRLDEPGAVRSDLKAVPLAHRLRRKSGRVREAGCCVGKSQPVWIRACASHSPPQASLLSPPASSHTWGAISAKMSTALTLMRIAASGLSSLWAEGRGQRARAVQRRQVSRRQPGSSSGAQQACMPTHNCPACRSRAPVDEERQGGVAGGVNDHEGAHDVVGVARELQAGRGGVGWRAASTRPMLSRVLRLHASTPALCTASTPFFSSSGSARTGSTRETSQRWRSVPVRLATSRSTLQD